MKCIKSSLLLMFFVLFISCDSDDGNDDMMQEQFTAADAVMLQSVANTGNWRITSFVEDNEDITSFFEGFSLTFNNDGALVIQNDALSLNGTWRIDYDDDDDDNDVDDLEFELSISAASNDLPEELDELTDDWYVISYTDNRIVLSDDEDGNEDQLILERN